MAKITPQKEDFSKWYLDIIAQADLADYSAVKGCMIIKPYGYALWENIQKALDDRIKAKGVKNAYFPLFIPESFIKKEAEHVDGFAPELVTVTHVGEKELAEKLYVRPTSETIMYDAYSNWIKSYRDLPLLINQWANVVRWEKRTRPFLRTTEFLWQEGHTVHATEAEADEWTIKCLEMYRDLDSEDLAIPVVIGTKSESEKFPGAKYTTTTEVLAKDGKAIQAGTSHQLGQGFAKTFGIEFTDENEKQQHPWQTSWGVSTRIVGTLIVVHGDDKGLRIPPKIAPIQVVIVPIYRTLEEEELVRKECLKIEVELKEVGIKVELDDRTEKTPGFKFNEWELKGVPVRIEVGPRDLAKDEVVMARRDTSEKKSILLAKVRSTVLDLMVDIQKTMLEQAIEFQTKNTHEVFDYERFKEIIKENPGFIKAGWCGNEECESRIQSETKATIRCLPFEYAGQAKGECIYCKKEATQIALFAKAY